MKKLLFPLLAAFALTVGTAAAQNARPNSPGSGAIEGRGRMQGSPDEMAKRQAARMTQELGLNADQTTKVQQILLARGQEMQAMRGQARDAGNRDQMREQMQTGRAKYDAQFREVLTADQYTKYTTKQASRMNGMDVDKMKAESTDGDRIGDINVNINKMKAKSVDGDKIKIKESPIK